jgi:para-aminobenzoate synthetase component 1
MIRYIEQKNKHLYFRSGGGITALSNEEDEYHELLQKVYLPIF